MADSNRYGSVNQLGLEQILSEAQNRWLRPAEICEILKNHNNFRIAPEPAHMPPSGSLFLFNRKVLRYFRKDGHNWRKKKDGKTVKEAHERLKAGSVDVLHCYYAHGEENKNFQRRSYWMLEEELSHIVLVHYHEVKGNGSNSSRIRDSGEVIPYSQETSELESSVSSSFDPNKYQLPSLTPDTTSLSYAQASEHEDAESAYNHHASSGFHSFSELQQPVMEKIDSGLSVPYYPLPFSNDHQGDLSAIPGTGYLSHTREDRGGEGNASRLTYDPQKQLDFSSWEDVLEHNTATTQSMPFQTSHALTEINTMGIMSSQGNKMSGQILREQLGRKQESEYPLQGQDPWQTSEGCSSSHISKWPVDRELQSDSSYNINKGLQWSELNDERSPDSFESQTYLKEQNDHHLQNELHIQLSNSRHGCFSELDLESTIAMDGQSHYPSILKHSLLDGYLPEEGLKKLDSFNKWASKELGDVSESFPPSSSEAYWDIVESEKSADDSGVPFQSHLDTNMMGPSISQDQLFSFIDFTPSWACAGSEITVIVTGRFLIGQQNTTQWSCMFGEVEVPADVVGDGVLLCQAPAHKPGRVPFYVSCCNRLACSEVREFEYRLNHIDDNPDVDSGITSDIPLHLRFEKLVSLESECPPNCSSSITYLTSEEEVKDQQFQQLLKEKLHMWLLQKASEGGKGPSVLDKGGQGVLHFAAALGYDWAIQPTIDAGVNVNFRDVNGWTALHWAALCGRERTVASLISLGAAPGALTDPSPMHPSGLTPADLASVSSHKGIAGYLAESSLSAHLSSLELKETSKNNVVHASGAKAVQAVTDRSPTPFCEGDLPYGLSLKDSLAAVCNATQAASRIHQVFRVQSFQKKQLKAYGDSKIGVSDEPALSLIAVKSQKHGQHNEPGHAAATRIQNKFRSWKGRKDFLIIRQRIVKIQAHVRGHQVRKSYKKIIWSVGILEKVILRWRRKGSGLRGFKPEALMESPSSHDKSSKEDDNDFLKEGRRQTEERLQKALARVKSMVQYPEARDQYRRLLNVVSEIQETKAVHDKPLNSSEDTNDFDDLIDLEALLDDDTFMLS